jgi:hypothetical protein
MLAQKNEIIADLVMKEGNLPTGHQYTQRTGLPTIYFRLLNQGVPNSKSTTAQVTEQAAILEGRSADRSRPGDAERQLGRVAPVGDQALLRGVRGEGRDHDLLRQRGHGPEQFTGLSTRYSSLSAGNGGNIVDAGGTGSDNSSIWMIGHGDGFHGIYPKGSKAGLQHEDLGPAGRVRRVRLVEQPLPRVHGLVPVEARHRAARLEERRPHREPRHLQPGRAVGPGEHQNALDQGGNRIQTKQGVKIYMNRTIAAVLRDRAGGGQGRRRAHLRERRRPAGRDVARDGIRTVDSLLETEARVV